MAMANFRVLFDTLKDSMTQYFGINLTKITTLKNRLNTHIEETGNVHDMTASDIGLGSVQNWEPATAEQAIAGTNNTSYLTPKRMDQYADENIFTVIGEAFSAAADDL